MPLGTVLEAAFRARADEELTLEAEHALAARRALPSTIRVHVQDGHLTLTGQVPWMFHRIAAEVAVYNIPGVSGVTNRITVAPMPSYEDVRRRIAEALHGRPDGNVRHVNVAIKGTTAMLTGHVTSAAQREALERAAAAAPGIQAIENRIEVIPSIH